MERQVLELITQDRLEMPLSSLYQKVKRVKKKNAESLKPKIGERFNGERSYAFFTTEDKDRARGAKEAIVEFSLEYPKYGAILKGMIEEKRVRSEEHVYFGMQEGRRLTADDYIQVMTSLGLSENSARNLYPDLMHLSRKLANLKEEARSVIVGKYAVEE